jgi:glycosyltransferase involved in cell wall biosynthesis
VVVYLVTTLAAQGFRNVVLLPDRGEGWLAAQLPAGSAQVVHVPLLGVPVRTSFAAISAALRTHRPAVAHSHEFTMSALGGAAAWRLRIPHVLTMHGGRYYATRLYRRVALALAARVSSVVAVSQTVAAQLRSDLLLPARHVRVIPNGIPAVPDVPLTLRAELGLEAHAVLIVSVGSLYGVKGHADLVRALATVVAEVTRPVHLAIAGRGPEESSVASLAASLGVAHRVHLLGLRADVSNVLRSADLFALPSRSEALPLALLEAMSAGRPIVATDVGDVAALLQHGAAGLVTPPGDLTALASAMRQLIEEPLLAEQLAGRARAIARESYDIQGMTDRYRAVYAEGRAPPRIG